MQTVQIWLHLISVHVALCAPLPSALTRCSMLCLQAMLLNAFYVSVALQLYSQSHAAYADGRQHTVYAVQLACAAALNAV